MRFYKDRDWLHQKYWEEGLSQSQIGKICRVGRKVINTWMQRFDIRTRTKSEVMNQPKVKKRYREIRKRTLMFLLKSGNAKIYQDEALLNQLYWGEELSLLQIAEICNCDSKTPWYWMKKYGIKTRTMSENCKMVMNRPEVRKKHSEAINRPEAIKKNSKMQKIAKNLPGLKEKQRFVAKQNWQNPEYVKKTLRATNKRPTNPEKAFDKMTPKNVRYVGNGIWWRQFPNGKHKNPDFKITGQNKIIEIFGDYWHKNEDPQKLIELYKQVGLDCLVFWVSEIMNSPEDVKAKVDSFIN